MQITLFAMFFSLRIVLGYISIPLGPMVVSFIWVPILIAGFIFGPLIGAFFGVISDNFSFLIFSKDKIWLWQYSIQEPLICILGGLFLILYIKSKNIDSIKFRVIIYELILSCITFISILIITLNMNSDAAQDYGSSSLFKNDKIVKIISITIILIFYITSSIYIIYYKNKLRKINLYICSSLLVIIPWIIFSWIFGASFYLAYLKKRSSASHISSNWYSYFTLVRILKGMIMIPLETIIVFSLLKALENYSKRTQYFTL